MRRSAVSADYVAADSPNGLVSYGYTVRQNRTIRINDHYDGHDGH